MTQIVIIQSASGIYHLCHWHVETDKHYIIQEFVNRDLAEAMAWKMSDEMAHRLIPKGS